MSIERSSWIAVGFDFELDEVLKVLDQKTTPAVMQTEARYDEKTGKPLEPVEVVVQDEWTTYVIGEKEFNVENDGYNDMLEAVAKEIDCRIDFYAAYESGRVVLGIDLKETQEAVEIGHHTYIDGNYSLEELFKSKPKFTALRKKLVKMGLEPGEAEIITCWEIS